MLEVGGADKGALGVRAAVRMWRMTINYIFTYFYVYEYMPNQSKMI